MWSISHLPACNNPRVTKMKVIKTFSNRKNATAMTQACCSLQQSPSLTLDCGTYQHFSYSPVVCTTRERALTVRPNFPLKMVLPSSVMLLISALVLNYGLQFFFNRNDIKQYSYVHHVIIETILTLIRPIDFPVHTMPILLSIGVINQ